MVRCHNIVAQMPEPLLQVMGDPLCQAASIHEHQRGAMGFDQGGHPVVDVAPNGIGSDRAEFVFRHFDGKIHIATVSTSMMATSLGPPRLSPSSASDAAISRFTKTCEPLPPRK